VGIISAAPALIAAEACVLCASHADADRMLFCADCDEAFHIYCLFPGTTTINEARYVCVAVAMTMAVTVAVGLALGFHRVGGCLRSVRVCE
jgi:hypothetical protein